MAKGKRDYDADIAVEAAANLNAAAALGQSQLWPADSDNATDATDARVGWPETSRAII